MPEYSREGLTLNIPLSIGDANGSVVPGVCTTRGESSHPCTPLKRGIAQATAFFSTSKRLAFILLLFALPLLSLANDDAKALFAQGNDQYAKAKYADAVKTYQSILGEGYQSVVVYFNLGNAYYKLGDIPSALLYYEKAHRLNPADDDINFNIQLANLKTTDKVEAIPEFFLAKWWDAFVLGISAGALGWLSVILFIIGSGLLILYIFAPSVGAKRTAFFSALTALSLGLIAILVGAVQVHYFASHQQAIVFSPTVNVKSEPGTAGKTLFVIHDGTKVDVLENSNNWLRVKLLNGNEGWIMVGDAKEI